MIIQETTKGLEKPDMREPLNTEEILILQEMAEAGLLYGLSKSKTHPKMKQYIYATRSGMEIINLEYTIKNLNYLSEVMRKVTESGKKILIIGTSPSVKGSTNEFAEKIGQPYVVNRWLGGTLTNLKVISGRIKEYNKIIEDKESGALKKYTKKERIMIDKKLTKMKLLFEGIRNLNEMPGAMLVLDIQANMTAVREAKQMGIPVIALVNTDINPELVDYALPCNNRLQGAISWI